MYEFNKDAFIEKMAGGDLKRIEEFWRAMAMHPAYAANHPIHAKPGHQKWCIPVSLHGDGVAITGISKAWAKSADGISWTSLLQHGPAITSNFLVCLLNWQFVTDDEDNLWEQFKKRLAWSFYWLFQGVWPDRDECGNKYPCDSVDGRRAGSPLAGGYYGCLWVIRGDLEYMTKAWGFPSATGVKRCALCRADTRLVPWTDVRPEAAWRATCWKAAPAWARAHQDRSVLFREVPGLSVLNYMPDAMHTLHLGVYQYFFGSILEYLTHHILPRSPEKNMFTVWMDILEKYKELKVENRFTALRVSAFKRKDKMPLLKGKAANIAGLAKPLLAVTEKHLKAPGKHHTMMKLAMHKCVELEEILHAHPDVFVLPARVAKRFSQAAQALIALSSGLRSHFLGLSTPARPVLLFHFTIKYHHVLHIGEAAAHMNPRLSWCYSGESLMHRVRILAQSSARGVLPHKVSEKVMKKYVMALAMSLAKHR
jgi:hypothetical protein